MASCGAKAPCCHVGYPHRHCEHCDVVIATYPTGWYQPLIQPSYPPYRQWYSAAGAAQTLGNVANFGVSQLQNQMQALAAGTSDHNCEVKN